MKKYIISKKFAVDTKIINTEKVIFRSNDTSIFTPTFRKNVDVSYLYWHDDESHIVFEIGFDDASEFEEFLILLKLIYV